MKSKTKKTPLAPERFSLKGKVVSLTGGAGMYGRGLARDLAETGCRLVLASAIARNSNQSRAPRASAASMSSPSNSTKATRRRCSHSPTFELYEGTTMERDLPPDFSTRAAC